MDAKDRIICAIDTIDAATGIALADSLKGAVGAVKLGKEFFAANGPTGVTAVGMTNLPIFLDLKFHDIPNTVAGAVKGTGNMRPAMLTIHASGGRAMITAAAQAAKEAASKFSFGPPLLLAVTVLTSLNEADLDDIGVKGPIEDQVRRLAALAQSAGADGVVCSPREVAMLRAECGDDFKLVTPGVRPADASQDDQKRTATPAQAIIDGADYLVIGRPITQASDPRAAALAIAKEISATAP